MRIKKIHIQNFKSLVDFELENPKPFCAFVRQMQGSEKIVILTDLDNDACITLTKQRISARPNDVVIIAVNTIES